MATIGKNEWAANGPVFDTRDSEAFFFRDSFFFFLATVAFFVIRLPDVTYTKYTGIFKVIRPALFYRSNRMPESNFIITVGASAGGTLVLPALLKQLHPDQNISVFIVVHMGKKTAAEMFVKRVQKTTALTCKLAKNGESIKKGFVYVAQPDHHLLIKKNKILLGKGPMENRYRPSIDSLFRSAAAEHDHRVIGIILSGMLEDGVSGILAIKRSGGTCIIQDPNEAQYPDMPKAAISNVKADYIIPVSEMGEAISQTISKPPKKAPIPDDIRKEADIAERVQLGINQVEQFGERSIYSCPDCGGGLWQHVSEGITRYRCHVGHAYSEEGLLTSMQVTTESALWTAMRIIEERRNLLKTLAEKEGNNGSKHIQRRYRTRMKELELQLNHLKTVLLRNETD
jgi:two-component system, chemotaxis family, protein-glutamate methylesterase/glutaminase